MYYFRRYDGRLTVSFWGGYLWHSFLRKSTRSTSHHLNLPHSSPTDRSSPSTSSLTLYSSSSFSCSYTCSTLPSHLSLVSYRRLEPTWITIHQPICTLLKCRYKRLQVERCGGLREESHGHDG